MDTYKQAFNELVDLVKGSTDKVLVEVVKDFDIAIKEIVQGQEMQKLGQNKEEVTEYTPTKAEWEKMKYTERVDLKKQHPAGYARAISGNFKEVI